ncbi:MAG: hypothetical protein JXR53_09810 [Bacteroidales bacterium]|nr:hypothetical protein [Bacteroidales bacterium]
MIGLNKKYLRLRVFLILKCFSIISFLIISAGCRNQKGKLKSAVKETNKIYLENPEILQDTMQNAEVPVVKDSVVPIYEPPVEVICDYGVIRVVEPPIIDQTLYGVIPETE